MKICIKKSQKTGFKMSPYKNLEISLKPVLFKYGLRTKSYRTFTNDNTHVGGRGVYIIVKLCIKIKLK